MLRMTNLSKVYRTHMIETHALRGFEIQVNAGEFVTVTGPSGSGKTSFLNIAGLLEEFTDGEYILDGVNVKGLDDNARSRLRNEKLGFIFQGFNLIPDLNLFDNVDVPLRYRGFNARERKERIEDALAKVGLASRMKHYPAELSGGQQQRVAIARAVVNRPRVLLLDESLSALDYKLRKQMQNELKALQRKLGITFVFVTHDQEEALTMSDRIVVMRDGRIEQDGTPRQIYEEPENLFVASFIGEINIFEAQVIRRLDDQRVRAWVEGRECDITVNQLAVTPGQRLNVLLRPEDLKVQEINEGDTAEGFIGHVRERNYKGMTLESTVELTSGKLVMVSEFFNEDDPDVDHSLDQTVAVTWIESWEVVLADEQLT